MARRLLIAGNWKLNLGPNEAHDVASAMCSALADRGEIEVSLFPTTLSILPVIEALRGSGIEVGLQDVHTEASGAYTGTNSASMGRAVGCTRALIGHSERRHLFGESNETAGLKVRAARQAGLLPVLCVGETLAQREVGTAVEVVTEQLSAGMTHLTPDQLSGFVIAYEPVWAIGTGVVATPDQAQEMHLSIRDWLRQVFPPFVHRETKILYGGSVKPNNARELLACPDIDGALVGGASLQAESFSGIVRAALGL